MLTPASRSLQKPEEAVDQDKAAEAVDMDKVKEAMTATKQ